MNRLFRSMTIMLSFISGLQAMEVENTNIQSEKLIPFNDDTTPEENNTLDLRNADQDCCTDILISCIEGIAPLGTIYGEAIVDWLGDVLIGILQHLCGTEEVNWENLYRNRPRTVFPYEESESS